MQKKYFIIALLLCIYGYQYMGYMIGLEDVISQGIGVTIDMPRKSAKTRLHAH